VYFSSLLGTLKAVIGGRFVKKRPTLHDHHHIEELLYGQPFQIPAQFTFVGRAISTLFGVLTGLAPDFNFIDVAASYAHKFMGIDTLEMPGTIEAILTKLEAGQFVINLGGNIGIGATALRKRESNSANTVFLNALALMFIPCLGVAAFFLHDHDQILSFVALFLAGFLGLCLF
jgi:hypothetical protein